MTENETVPLKEHLETEISTLSKLIDEKDRLYDTRFKASETAVNAALAAQEKAVAAAFLASEKAIVKAEDAQKDYNERSNEFRGQLDDQAKTLMPRLESLGLFKGIDDKITVLQKSFEDKLEAARINNEKVADLQSKEIAGLRESRSEGTGKSTQQASGTSFIFSSIAFLIGITSLVVSVILHFVH